MIDCIGNELKKGDLVAFAKSSGSSARMHIAVVTDPESNAIFSMYTYSVGNDLVKVYSSREGKSAGRWKLIQIDPANDHMLNGIHAELKEKAKKYL